MHLIRLIFLSKNDSSFDKRQWRYFLFLGKKTDLCILRVGKTSAIVHAIKRGRPWPFDAGSVTLVPSKCIGDRCISRSCSAAARAGKTPFSAQSDAAHRRALSSERCPKFIFDAWIFARCERERGRARFYSADESTVNALSHSRFLRLLYRLFNRVSRAFSWAKYSSRDVKK